jgi:hypothetical protein
MYHDHFGPVNSFQFPLARGVDINTHSRRKDDDFMWTIYVDIFLVRCLPAIHKSSPPYSAGRFEGDRILGMPDSIFLLR